MTRNAIRTLLPLLASGFATGAMAGETNGGPIVALSCPAKGAVSRDVDLSTGAAPWVATGPEAAPTRALATPIDPAAIPAGWSARLPGAVWVQALPQTRLSPHAEGDYLFAIEFTVAKGKRMPRLALTGAVAADEGIDVNLIEPSPPNGFIGGGPGSGIDDTPGTVSQADVLDVDMRETSDGTHRPLGSRPGRYRLQVTVNNSAGHPQLGFLGRLRLSSRCG